MNHLLVHLHVSCPDCDLWVLRRGGSPNGIIALLSLFSMIPPFPSVKFFYIDLPNIPFHVYKFGPDPDNGLHFVLVLRLVHL